MTCQVCGHKPRMFEMFGGGYWHSVLHIGRGTDHWVCPCCWHWASRFLLLVRTRPS